MLHNSQFTKLSSTLTVLIFFVLLTSCTVAQKPAENRVSLNKASLQNLMIGIKSENTGIRRDAVKFVGTYSIEEAAETLIEQLEVEKDPQIRVLITKALYLIDDGEYMNEIKNLAFNDKNYEVRELAKKLYPTISMELN